MYKTVITINHKARFYAPTLQVTAERYFLKVIDRAVY